MLRTFPGRTDYDGTTTLVCETEAEVLALSTTDYKPGSVAIIPNKSAGSGVVVYMLFEETGWWKVG